MRLYTKRGDDGRTDLIGGSRVPKHHVRVEAYGCVDELNASIGLALSGIDQDAVSTPLITAQRRLFDLGAQLASPGDAGQAAPRIQTRHIDEVEAQIDAASDRVEPLQSFILPGGSGPAARLHVARTVCRRAERAVVALSECEKVDPLCAVYLNRLSDLLFALARLSNKLAGVADVPWVADTDGDG